MKYLFLPEFPILTSTSLSTISPSSDFKFLYPKSDGWYEKDGTVEKNIILEQKLNNFSTISSTLTITSLNNTNTIIESIAFLDKNLFLIKKEVFQITGNGTTTSFEIVNSKNGYNLCQVIDEDTNEVVYPKIKFLFTSTEDKVIIDFINPPADGKNYKVILV